MFDRIWERGFFSPDQVEFESHLKFLEFLKKTPFFQSTLGIVAKKEEKSSESHNFSLHFRDLRLFSG